MYHLSLFVQLQNYAYYAEALNAMLDSPLGRRGRAGKSEADPALLRRTAQTTAD